MRRTSREQPAALEMPPLDREREGLLLQLQQLKLGDPNLTGFFVQNYQAIKDREPKIAYSLMRVGQLVEGYAWDPELTHLIQWPEARRWIEAEIRASGGGSKAGLAELREKFARDENDFPKMWKKLEDDRYARNHIADLHCAVLCATTLAESLGTDHQVVIDLLFRIHGMRELCEKLYGGPAELPFPNIVDPNAVARFIEESYRDSIFVDSRFALPTMAERPEPVRRLVASKLQARWYEPHRPAPDSLWGEVEQVQRSYHEGADADSNYEQPFAADELRTYANREGSHVVTLSLRQRVVGFSLVLPRPGPKTRAKLAPLSPYSIPNGEEHSSWELLAVAEKKAIREIGRDRADLYSILVDLTKQIQRYLGRESLLGMVDEKNPARLSHERNGAKDLDPTLRFPTDHGGNGIAIGCDLFS